MRCCKLSLQQQSINTYYSTGSLYATWTQIFAATPQGTIVAATIPVGREGLVIEDDWDGFGQRLTGTGTTLLNNVHVSADEVEDFGDPDKQESPSYQYSFLQLFLQAVAAGILRAVKNDAVALVQRRKRNFSYVQSAPTADPQVLRPIRSPRMPSCSQRQTPSRVPRRR
jgi:alkylation response protein AidB-like acyl-CoA dehydrogenase